MLGSDTETLTFVEDGVDVEPVGRAHAVDPASSLNSAGGILAYALCGRAVRAWPEREFDPSAVDAHEECAARLVSGRPD